MNQLALVEGFYVRGAVAENIGGQLALAGFANGLPVFQVNPVGSISIDTTAATNTLSPAAQSVMYGNDFGGAGEVLYTLPSPTSAQRLSISNANGRSNQLRIAAPAGVSIRWIDGTLHSAIVSDGNEVDNVAFVGESNSIWRVTYAGESGSSTWTPE